jgi:hypothetical protein
MSRFIFADITDPKSIPKELEAIVRRWPCRSSLSRREKGLGPLPPLRLVSFGKTIPLSVGLRVRK